MEKVICEICGSKDVRKVRRPFTGSYNAQVRVTLRNVEMYECKACGEQFLTPESAKLVSEEVKSVARSKLGLLSPEKILAIRRRYGLSQEGLERLLGLGQKVVTRWERGKVLQTKAADVVLRLMERLPGVVVELQAIRRSA